MSSTLLATRRVSSHIVAGGGTKVSTFTDDCDDLSLWDFNSGVTASGGHIIVPCNTSYISASTQAVLSMRDSSVLTEVQQVQAVGNSTMSTQLRLVKSDYSANSYCMIKAAGNLQYGLQIAGVDVQTVITWDATAHRWWKIFESVGRVFFAVSPNGTNWTTLDVNYPCGEWHETARINLMAGYWGTETPTDAWFDNINLPRIGWFVLVGGVEIPAVLKNTA